MNENINLVEILKDCSKGTKLYSPLIGEVEFIEIVNNNDWPIRVLSKTIGNIIFNKKGQYFESGECLLFPSKDIRTWDNFKLKKSKFNPNTLQPFDKLLVRDCLEENWSIDFFSYIDIQGNAVCTGKLNWIYYIPYNEETKHLINTSKEEPEFYCNWKK